MFYNVRLVDFTNENKQVTIVTGMVGAISRAVLVSIQDVTEVTMTKGDDVRKVGNQNWTDCISISKLCIVSVKADI